MIMRLGSLYAAMALVVVLLSTAPAQSAEDTRFELKAAAGIRDVLLERNGKRVAVRLVSGQELEGTVTLVGNSLVHISSLVGMEYYDAVVSIDKIAAIRMRVRDR